MTPKVSAAPAAPLEALMDFAHSLFFGSLFALAAVVVTHGVLTVL